MGIRTFMCKGAVLGIGNLNLLESKVNTDGNFGVIDCGWYAV
jgi:hypothetical protein